VRHRIKKIEAGHYKLGGLHIVRSMGQGRFTRTRDWTKQGRQILWRVYRSELEGEYLGLIDEFDTLTEAVAAITAEWET